MKKVFSDINTGDVVFLAILSGVLLLVSSIVMPVVMFTSIFGLRQLLAAPFFAFFIVIALRRVPKPGALVIIGFLTGGVLLFMSSIMFFNNIIGAFFAELFALLIFKSYDNKTAIKTASVLFMPLTLPVTVLATMIIKGLSLSQILNSPVEIIIIPIGTLILSYVGAFFGMRFADELKRAGKI